MKLKTACLAVALTASVAIPVQAGDWGGSIKDGGGYSGVPVPAPIPIPDTFSWYIRGDVAIGTATSGDVSDRGREYGIPPPPCVGDCFRAAVPFGMSSNWFEGKFDNQFSGGFGIGRYISPQFRMDATLDFTTEGKIDGSGDYSYAEVDPGGVPNSVTINGHTSDQLKITDTIALFNAYYDIVPRGRLTPYVGLGVGFAARNIDRTHYTHETRYDALGNNVGERTWSGDSRETRIAPAAAATVGLAYAITPGVIVDLNYRYTYIGEVETKMDITSNFGEVQRSKMTIGDTHMHALRAGMRVNIW